jgi:hypothetical protein
MLEFILDPKNHSQFDDIVLDIDIVNNRNRTPLFLVFTPPTGTFMGLHYGLDENCTPNAQKPLGVESLADWVKPGGPKQREIIVDLLIAHGANVRRKVTHSPVHPLLTFLSLGLPRIHCSSLCLSLGLDTDLCCSRRGRC